MHTVRFQSCCQQYSTWKLRCDATLGGEAIGGGWGPGLAYAGYGKKDTRRLMLPRTIVGLVVGDVVGAVVGLLL